MQQARRHGLKGLEELLSLRIVGHEDAIKRIVKVVRTAKARLDAKPERPDGIFLLAGPSGSGKTETALALNDALFGQSDTLLRLDMSEFHFRESISSLIGMTPGFVGFEQGGRLTNFVKRKPESVVLLDEIEKAHPLVLDVFLQVFDSGRLTDGQGNTVDFSKVTFLMTTKIGADVFASQKSVGFVKQQKEQEAVQIVKGILRKQLRPEFVNRFDDVLVFTPLTEKQKLEVCQRQLKQLQERFARRGLWLDLAPDLATHLTAKSDDKQGARGIQRALETHISQPLTELLLDRPNLRHIMVEHDGDKIRVHADHIPHPAADEEIDE